LSKNGQNLVVFGHKSTTDDINESFKKGSNRAARDIQHSF